MTHRMKTGLALFLAAIIAIPMIAANQDKPADVHDEHGHVAGDHHDHGHDTQRRNETIRQALIAWRETLSPELVEKATFSFDGKERKDWHFVPRSRPGVTFRDMNLDQRKAAHALLRAALSDQGYFKSIAIMSLDDDLRRIEAGRENINEIRNSEKYYFTIYGDPATSEKDGPDGEFPGAWGWKVEGHHLSLNFSSVAGDMVSVTPAFFGANPAEIRVGPRAGHRPLGNEEDFAYQLVRMLDEDQRKTAIIAESAPRDIITGPGSALTFDEPHGLSAAHMNARQQHQLRDIIYAVTNNFTPELRDHAMDEIKEAGFDKLHFAWAGSLEKGQGHYYRVHGPTFILEFDNVQGGANHIHLVWHSPNNDFGLDALKKHYAEAAHHQNAAE